ncbi:trypsin-like serine peptidase [Neogemmobacter tilapiae]|uniref:Serine protease n=1 Tax=Neogemmobacter tilapiae TaxID=875041 RepID=A0A918WLB8_9RHOB|nr:serine protease [Gemmobacter tilapiae]GHC55995.1 serine protease [Gemmobacter tilapiae]
MRVWAGLLAWIFGLAVPALAQDSALTPLTSRYQLLGWEAVGRVEVYSNGRLQSTCTGTLIARDLVLTAAHCVWQDGATVSADQVGFRAGYLNGSSIADSRVAKLAVLAGYAATDKSSVAQVRQDVALLELSQSIDSTQAAPFSVDLPDQDSEISVVSYGQGREEYLSWQKRCMILGRYDGLYALSCRATFGTSGAPVFDRSGGRSRIVSIISGTGVVEGETVSFGMILPEQVATLKAQLRQGGGVAAEPGTGAKRIGVGERKTTGGAKFVKP